MKKYLLIIISLVLCVSFVGCSNNNQMDSYISNIISSTSNTIAKPTKEELANTKEYIVTQDTLMYFGNTQDDFIEDMQKSFNKGLPVATYWESNEDGTMSVFCTPEQAGWQRDNAKDFVSKMQDKATQSGSSVEINEDYTNIVFNISSNMQLFDLGEILKITLAELSFYQTFNGVSPNQIYYNYKMIYMPTGKIITEGRYPDKKMTFTEDEFAAAKIPN